jgi:CheY-like chemotaxis protein
MSRIFIVEDELSLQVALRSQLTALVDEVEVAEHVTEAIETLERIYRDGQTLELAVVDLHLPNEDAMDPDGGFLVVDRISSRFPSTPVIIMTIRNDSDARIKACDRHESIRYFFTKPWSSHELRTAALSCLERRCVGLEFRCSILGVRGS